MEKTLIIDGKEVRLKSTAGTLRRYRNQFNKDFFADIMKMYPLMQLQAKGIDTNNLDYQTLQHIDFSVFENIMWALAKTADNSIPDPDTWFDSFEEFPVMEILPEIQGLIEKSLQGTKKKMKKEESDGEPITTDSFLFLCKKAGLDYYDIENMTIGFCLDFIDESIERNKPKEQRVRRATQEDFDSF